MPVPQRSTLLICCGECKEITTIKQLDGSDLTICKKYRQVPTLREFDDYIERHVKLDSCVRTLKEEDPVGYLDYLLSKHNGKHQSTGTL